MSFNFFGNANATSHTTYSSFGGGIFSSIIVNEGNVTINGKKFVASEGESLEITVTVNGVSYKYTEPVTINVEGKCDIVKNTCGKVTVNGNADEVSSTSGYVKISGNVGSAKATSGDISIGGECGYADTKSGDIKALTFGKEKRKMKKSK